MTVSIRSVGHFVQLCWQADDAYRKRFEIVLQDHNNQPATGGKYETDISPAIRNHASS